MKYIIQIERWAEKSLRKIPKTIQAKIIKSIDALSTNPRPVGAKKLVGRDGWRSAR